MKFFDPFRWVSEQEYSNFWNYMLNVLLSGFWIRLIAFVFLATGVWVLVKKRNLQVGVILILVSVFCTYILGLVRLL